VIAEVFVKQTPNFNVQGVTVSGLFQWMAAVLSVRVRMIPDYS